MPKIQSIHLATTHRAFDTRIFHKECKTFAAAGYDVTFIVPHDRDEVVDGVQIRAVPKPASGKERLAKTLGEVYRAALLESPDAIYHFHDSELIFHMLALSCKGRKVIYDAHEDTPKQVMYQHWIPKAVRPVIARFMEVAEWIGGRQFGGVIAAEPGIANRFQSSKTALIRNFPLLNELTPVDPIPYTHRPARIAYIGSITEVRGIREMMAAISQVSASLDPELVLGGPFHPAGLEFQIAQWPGAARTTYRGWLHREQVAEVLGQSRAGIVTIYPTPKYLESYPTKLFEYMAAGLPVIASDFPGWRPFIEQHECGFLVDPQDSHAIARSMQWILEHPGEAEAMGKRGRVAVEKHYNWEGEIPRLLSFYQGVEVV